MAIIDYRVTPVNQPDAGGLVPLLLSMEEHETLSRIGDFYGNNAFFTVENRRWLSFYGKKYKFHSKEEPGKNPKERRSVRKKSRIRSKIESMFGIMQKNHNFGRTLVRGTHNVKIDTCLIVSSWNHFFLITYFMDRFEDRISLRKLFYEN
ncbi:hypothetical protein ES705_32302 [subsurface metagenome]